MRILILGGTQFMGSFITEALLARGDDVTLVHRGRSQVDAFADATHVHLDRADGHAQLAELGEWDAVIDVSGYIPGQVREAAQTLEPHAKRYVFISSVSVYDPAGKKTLDEKSPLLELKDRDQVADILANLSNDRDMELYGQHKVLAERAVTKIFGADRTTIVRPGVMAGPRDPTWRFSYWVDRAARGGNILAPGPPREPIQYIDARDVANFVIYLIDDGTDGVFNAVYPPGQIGLGGLIDTAVDLAGSTADITWAPADFLLAQGVEPWTELPLWIPPSGPVAMRAVSDRQAAGAGLRCRQIDQTVGDTLAYLKDHPDHDATGVITPEREAELIAAMPMPE